MIGKLRRRRNYWISVFLVFLPLLLLTLGVGVPLLPAAERFMVANSALNIFGTPVWLAKEKAIFLKYGLDVETIYIPSGTQAMQALLSGDVKAAVAAGTAAVNSRLQGAPLKIIAGVANYYTNSFFSTPDIKEPRDLRGKKVAVTRFGSSSHFATVILLKKFGLEEGKDYTILQLGSTQNRLIALTKGMIQGTTLSGVEAVMAGKARMNVLITVSDMRRRGIAFQHNGLVVTDLVLQKSKPLLKAFLKAYLEGVREVYRDKDATMRVLGKYTRVADREVLSATYDDDYEGIDKEGALIEEGIQVILTELGKADPRAAKAQPGQFLDPTLLQELSGEGFIKALWSVSK